MKALVIGGTGPTGPLILKGLLERGYKTTIFHRGAHEIDLPSEIEHIHGDPHFVETINESLGSHTFDLVIGMYGRLRHVAEAMKGRTERLICAGGVGVYKSWFDPTQPFSDDSFLIPEHAPLTCEPEVNETEMDGFSKFSYLMVKSELSVIENHHLGFYNTTLFRFPMIYGPRQLIPGEWSIMRRILDKRKKIIIPDCGLAFESRGYSENMAHGVLLAIDHPEESAGQVYNIADEDVLSVIEIIEIISNEMDHKFEYVNMPASIAAPSIPYGMPIRPFAGINGMLHHRVLDINKIKDHLGYRDLYKAKDGIKKTVQYYLENQPEKGGDIEKRLNDRFDYENEDKLICEYQKSCKTLSKIYTVDEWRHPYPHPKKPGMKLDQSGR